MAQSAIAKESHPNPVIDLNVQSRDSSVRELDRFLSASLGAEASIRTARKFTKLSIIVAVYNEEVTLWPCIKAVLVAPLPPGIDREVILVDDGSTDRSWEVAQRLAKAHPQVP